MRRFEDLIETRWPLGVERIHDWSNLISLEEVDAIGPPAYPSGALISVRFRCTRCDTWLVAFEVKIPSYADGFSCSETLLTWNASVEPNTKWRQTIAVAGGMLK